MFLRVGRFVYKCYDDCVLIDDANFVHIDGNWMNCSIDILEPENWF